MPYLLIQTNRPLDSAAQTALLGQSSRLVAQWLGKPEQYVVVALQAGSVMSFGGSDAPCAYLELKSIGLAEAQLPSLSAKLCDHIGSALGVSNERIYIEFSTAEPQWWGWNGATF